VAETEGAIKPTILAAALGRAELVVEKSKSRSLVGLKASSG